MNILGPIVLGRQAQVWLWRMRNVLGIKPDLSVQANYNNLDEDNVDIMFKTKLHFQNILSAYFVRIFLQNIMFKTKYYDCENLGQAAPSLCCTV